MTALGSASRSLLPRVCTLAYGLGGAEWGAIARSILFGSVVCLMHGVFKGGPLALATGLHSSQLQVTLLQASEVEITGREGQQYDAHTQYVMNLVYDVCV